MYYGQFCSLVPGHPGNRTVYAPVYINASAVLDFFTHINGWRSRPIFFFKAIFSYKFSTHMYVSDDYTRKEMVGMTILHARCGVRMG